MDIIEFKKDYQKLTDLSIAFKQEIKNFVENYKNHEKEINDLYKTDDELKKNVDIVESLGTKLINL